MLKIIICFLDDGRFGVYFAMLLTTITQLVPSLSSDASRSAVRDVLFGGKGYTWQSYINS